MGAIVIRTRYDEGTESAEIATSDHWQVILSITKAQYKNEYYLKLNQSN
jgi:hypothetical protein